MAVKLRLRRMGKKKHPTYRVVATDSRSPRDGRFIELIGLHKDESAQQLASSVVESVLDFCSGAPQTDDITLLVIKCTN